MRKLVVLALVVLVSCSDEEAPQTPSSSSPPPPGPAPTTTVPPDTPPAGNTEGKCAIPPEAVAEDVSSPRTVVGTGTAASCTGDAFVDAVAKGGVITFNCGDAPATITLTKTAKIVNNTGPKIVIDGGGKVTLSGGGQVRILYMSTCDKNQVWISNDCNNQMDPQLTVQNLTFVDGNATSVADTNNAGGGGAIYAQGGRLKVVNSRFFGNVCAERGSDVGGGAIRVLNHIKTETGGSPKRPAFIVNSTFGAKDMGNRCANGGAISGLGASDTIINSTFSFNAATGTGASAGEGGNGGAMYNDGNLIHTSICGTTIEDNTANEGGSAIFFVSNDGSGALEITDSTLRRNPRGKFETSFGIFFKSKEGQTPTVKGSTIER